MRRLIAAFAVAAVSCAAPAPPVRPPQLEDGWTTATPEEAGVDGAALQRMTAEIRRSNWNIHSVLIEHGGRLIYEEYFPGADERWGIPLRDNAHTRERRHDLRSVTKSVVSALVGIAQASGAITSLDRPLVEYFPEYLDLQTPDRRRVTLRHALTMSAGYQWNEDVSYADRRNSERVMSADRDPVRYVLSRPIETEPGAHFTYNGGLPQVLAAIVQRTTGEPIADYANRVLFTPLGITDVEWVGNLAGLPSAASGIRLRPRDAAKFGSLYLHQGRWHDRQIVPAAWVHDSTAQTMSLGSDGLGYARLWWHRCLRRFGGSIEVHEAVGNGSQRIYVLPYADTVVTFFAGRYNERGPDPTLTVMMNDVLPAIHAHQRAKCPDDEAL